jgi:hypothetical protein
MFRTFLQSAVAVIALDIANVTSLDSLKTLAVSALAAGVSGVMGLITRPLGDPNSASVLEPRDTVPSVPEGDPTASTDVIDSSVTVLPTISSDSNTDSSSF